MNWLSIVFAMNFSFLLLHEMDAIKAKEWRLFNVLSGMKEEKAYIIFSLVHLPVYTCIIYIFLQMPKVGFDVAWVIADILLIIHAIVHFTARGHIANGFKSLYSNILIYGICFLSIIHLIILFNNITN